VLIAVVLMSTSCEGLMHSVLYMNCVVASISIPKRAHPIHCTVVFDRHGHGPAGNTLELPEEGVQDWEVTHCQPFIHTASRCLTCVLCH